MEGTKVGPNGQYNSVTLNRSISAGGASVAIQSDDETGHIRTADFVASQSHESAERDVSSARSTVEVVSLWLYGMSLARVHDPF